MMLCHDQPLRTDAMSWYPYSEAREAVYAYVDRFQEPGNLSFRVGNILKVPRETCPVGKEDFRTVRAMPAINCKKGPKNADQARCIAESLNLLHQGRNHVIEAPTGWGKTYAGTAVAAALGQVTLICCPKTDLMQQWYSTLVNLIGVPPEKIGRIQGNVCDYKDKWFVLGMMQSLMIPNRYPDEMYSYFGMMVLDETHRVAADCFQRTCQFITAKYRLGLSATPKRTDGRDNVIQAHIGPVLVRGKLVPMQPKIITVQTGWKIPRVRRLNYKSGTYETVPLPHAPGRMMTVYKAMASDDARNAILVNFARQAYASGRTNLLLSDLIDDHLKVLFFKLVQAGIPGEDIDYYIGGRKAVELKNAAHKRVILGTYKMVSEGTDYPHWNTLTLCLPRAKVKQAIGRVMREEEGKVTPVIFDPIDHDSIFGGFYRSRQMEYYSVGGTIVKK